MNRLRSLAFAALALAAASVARAQDAALDSTAAAAAPASSTAPAAPAKPPRASWLTDRAPLHVGDVLTVVIAEKASATEHVSTLATGNRSQRADLNAGIGDDVVIGPHKSFGTSLNTDQRNVGQTGRDGGLDAVLAVRVTEVSTDGIAKISGTKKVTVDGRVQEVTLTGAVRSEDVTSRHVVRSDAIVDASITYKGKKLAPKTGLLGSILNAVWP